MSTVKPPYHVPLMAEIAEIPWNGYTAVSTFSGCGGSCLGFKMQGFRVLWASEFVPAAQETYRTNHPGTTLDTRDIRQVEPDDVLAATGMARGEIDVLEGSPPCASFSTSGKRERGWGQVRPYSDTKQRTDDLFWEFARILEGLQPRAFVAENVAGLVRGIAKGYFKRILARLRECGYRVQAKVLDAQWLGVPQSRTRVIFIGVRADLAAEPQHPQPLPYRYTLRDALPWVVTAEEDTGGVFGLGCFAAAKRPSPCVQCRSGVLRVVEEEASLEGYAVGEEWERLNPGEGSDRYLNLLRSHTDRPSPCITASGGHGGTASATHPNEKRKFSIAELKRVCGFPDDFVLTGTYAQQWERLGRAVPPVMMSHVARTVRDAILRRCGGA